MDNKPSKKTSIWTKEDSHLTLNEIQFLLIKGGIDQAVDYQWTANMLVSLAKGFVAEHNQSPCDTCNLQGTDCSTDCKHK